MFGTVSRSIWNFSRRVKRNILNEFGIPLEKNPEQQMQKKQSQLTKEELEELQDTIVPLNQKASLTNRILKEVDKELMYNGEDRHPNKLVNRIQKGAVWGLGGQLIQFSRKINKVGVEASVEAITQYLKNQQTRDIYVHDFGDSLPHIRRWGIIASAYSNRHCYKVGIDLKNSFNDARKYQQFPAHMTGSKDQQWVLVEFSDFTVHIMTEPQRAEADLEWKWNNPVSQAVLDKYTQMSRHKSRGFFEPLDD